MRVAFLALAALVSVTALASVEAAMPAPPPARDIENYQPVAEGCGYGWHWTSGHTASGGGWVAGHCQSDR